VTQCKALLNDTTNDLASKLDSVTITSISTSTVDSLTLNLRLVTMAGEVGSLALPAPLLSTPVYNG
jgi:hypothetical protein